MTATAAHPTAACTTAAHPTAACTTLNHTATAPTAGTAPTARTTLRAEGFSCPSCVVKIEKRVGRLAGVTGVKVHFASARIEIDYDPAALTVADLVAAVADAGYTARPSTI